MPSIISCSAIHHQSTLRGSIHRRRSAIDTSSVKASPIDNGDLNRLNSDFDVVDFQCFRLRKKKRQRRSGGDSHDDAMSMDSQLPPPHSLAAVATDVYPTTVMPPPPHANPAPPPSTPRSYWLSWWKPSSTNEHVFDARPAPPPSYDAAMTLAHPDVRARSASNRGGEFDYYDYEDEGAERGEDDDDDGSVSGNSLAPPYSQIHLDPIIPDWVNPVTSRAAAPAGDPDSAQTPAPCSLPPPRVPDAASFPTSGLPETARNRRQHARAQCRGQGARAGAALVLPVLPPTFGATTVAVAARRPSSQMESRQVGRRGEGEGGHCHHHTASSSSSGRRLVNLSARSREGIVALPPSLPPREHDASDAALQRLSLPLHLNISDSSDSSGPALEVVETAQDDSPASST